MKASDWHGFIDLCVWNVWECHFFSMTARKNKSSAVASLKAHSDMAGVTILALTFPTFPHPSCQEMFPKEKDSWAPCFFSNNRGNPSTIVCHFSRTEGLTFGSRIACSCVFCGGYLEAVGRLSIAPASL